MKKLLFLMLSIAVLLLGFCFACAKNSVVNEMIESEAVYENNIDENDNLGHIPVVDIEDAKNHLIGFWERNHENMITLAEDMRNNNINHIGIYDDYSLSVRYNDGESSNEMIFKSKLESEYKLVVLVASTKPSEYQVMYA